MKDLSRRHECCNLLASHLPQALWGAAVSGNSGFRLKVTRHLGLVLSSTCGQILDLAAPVPSFIANSGVVHIYSKVCVHVPVCVRVLACYVCHCVYVGVNGQLS